MNKKTTTNTGRNEKNSLQKCEFVMNFSLWLIEFLLYDNENGQL